MHIAGGRYMIVHADGSRDEGRFACVAAAAATAAARGVSAAPHHEADIVCETGAGAGQILRAILRRRGNLIQLCYHAEENSGRPAAFATGRGSLAVLVRYRRIIADADADASQTLSSQALSS